MTSPTHIALTAAATLSLTSLTGLQPDTAGWLALLIGTLAPDIDTEHSAIARPGSLIKPFIPKFVRLLADGAGTVLSRCVRRTFGHRNAVHWPIIGAACIGLGLWQEWIWLSWFGWGYVWHILGDFSTKAGAPLLGPFSQRDYHWSPLRTGSAAETALFLALTAFVCWQGWPYLPIETRKWLIRYGHLLCRDC